MHFEKLELIGFKSFAEKTVLQFEPGVTTVVGPNGCGKSNIADSIRWALGEQSSRSLRASKMEDVIFNGTHTKEPINYAEVSVTFSNQNRSLPIDYDQVTITRRIFRSGETEYLLNRTPVRLKDINELLMGTGIGTESYSIIEQGKMDLILSSRAEDRRYVFEEASGITKYKSKKREAMRKLDEAENNLVRINDIIQEVKRQINSIERQARKAERYKVEFDRLKDLELRQSSFEYKNMRSLEKTSSVEGEDIRSREKELVQEVEAVNQKLTGFRVQLDEINTRITGLSARYTEVTTTIDKNSHRVEVDKERVSEARALLKSVTEEIASLEEKIKRQQEIVESVRVDHETARSESEANARTLISKEERLKELTGGIAQLDRIVKQGKTSTVGLMSEETRIKNELIKLGAEVQNRRSRSRRLGAEKENTTAELKQQDKGAQEAKELCAESERRVAGLSAEIDSTKQKREGLSKEITCTEGSLAKERNNITALRSKLEFLEDLVKRREGFKAAVKYILTKHEQDPGLFSRIHGVLADMISISDGYHFAVEAALGEDAQTMVMETDADVTKAIACLEEGNAGRASFVSLEWLNTARRAQQAEGAIGADSSLLSGFVKAAPEYGIIVDHFLGDVHIVDPVDDLTLKRGQDKERRLVTKTGILIDNKKISGGNIGERQDVSIVGRRDRISAIKAELESLDLRVEALTRQRDEKALSMRELERNIQTEENALRAEQISLANRDSRRKAIEDVAAKLKEELSVLELEIDEVNQVIEDLTKRGEELNCSLNGIEKENADLQVSIENAQNEAAGKRQEKETLMLEESSLRAKMDSATKELTRLEQGREKEDAFLEELKRSIESKKNSVEEISLKAGSLEDEISQLSAQNAEMSGNSGSLREDLSKIEREKSDTTDKLSIDELSLKDKESELEILRNQVRDMDLKKMEVGYKMSGLKERILQAYKADLDTLQIEIDEAEDWEGVRSQIEELRSKLDGMGQVNLVAIDEHKELRERYSFLVHQQEDLLNAKESIHKAILKINKTTKELFMEAFQKIQVEFKNYFRLLFGGGQAELILIDEEDVLESGIEIVARPPGKKLQNILLLSGGEKALTAISLLFSIFKVKPSPFCILDEIDAPLDESNVDRFSKVLQDFVKMSQFIIITHNKKTIELADVMYGITMQERGVSKIVSVKFLENQKAIEKEEEQVPA
ncbi:chromosome segregation protein SMC [Candidatus Omnitrophota bacterium]